MTGAQEVAKKAIDNIDDLIVDMLAGNYLDNEVSLGRVICGGEELQIQLKVTKNRCDFLDSDEEDQE
jgi:hypothetical protein